MPSNKRSQHLKAAVVVVAAGRGTRFGAGRPKQFLPLKGKPLLAWPLKALERTPCVRWVVLVVAPERVAWAEAFVVREHLRKVRAVVAGGAERADSVRHGVAACPPEAEVVLVHDAARALVTPDIIGRVALAAKKTGAALAAWSVPDTLKCASPSPWRGEGRGGGGKAPRVRRTIPRDGLWLAQTPQGFRRDVLPLVFRGKVPKGTTDDVQLAERAGVPVELVPASPANFKVTLPEDFDLCRKLL